MSDLASLTLNYETALAALLSCDGDASDADERDFIAATGLSRAFAALIRRTPESERPTIRRYIELRMNEIIIGNKIIRLEYADERI